MLRVIVKAVDFQGTAFRRSVTNWILWFSLLLVNKAVPWTKLFATFDFQILKVPRISARSLDQEQENVVNRVWYKRCTSLKLNIMKLISFTLCFLPRLNVPSLWKRGFQGESVLPPQMTFFYFPGESQRKDAFYMRNQSQICLLT